ncbi:hypothetical protein DL764_009952 [Monosporascus ibericus]|uniref:2,5-diamino-6-ribosylamino-4(3H)-pyrimidinone 5'-phosphate reductase n=1 Tax=Monosporascus ibericus TaxID=155417 RepID=A0A4Q4STQ8_9PEZI|nr:hypothetical protein DL764_009952 [Monosporascus ibericus]
MARIRYNVAATLDGFIASPDGSTDWIVEDPTIDFAELFSQFDSFIMGRKTWETLVGFGDQNPLRNLPGVEISVASTTLDGNAPENRNVTLLRDEGEILQWARSRKEGGSGKDLWVYGGGALCEILLRAGLVETVEVAIMPVLIGTGIKLIEARDGQSSKWRLSLQDVKALKSGIVMSRYLVLYG